MISMLQAPAAAVYHDTETGKNLPIRVAAAGEFRTVNRLRVRGKGGVGLDGAPGDLYFRVKIRPNPLIQRDGNDLTIDLPVTVGEAMLGATIDVPTPPKGRVQMKVPPKSQSGQRLRLKGRGVVDPKTKAAGDLYVRLIVHVGFRENPDVNGILRLAARKGLVCAVEETSYFTSKPTIVSVSKRGPFGWRRSLFGWMVRNSASVADYFRLPPNRVIELGTQVAV